MSGLKDLEKRREYYNGLSDEKLDEVWGKRDALKLGADEQNMLRFIVRNRKGFKPANPHVSMCKRRNLPADNCACQNL